MAVESLAESAPTQSLDREYLGRLITSDLGVKGYGIVPEGDLILVVDRNLPDECLEILEGVSGKGVQFFRDGLSPILVTATNIYQNREKIER